MMRHMNKKDFIDMMAAIAEASPEIATRKVGFVPHVPSAHYVPIASKCENHKCDNNHNDICNDKYRYPENTMRFDSVEDFLNAVFGGTVPTQHNEVNKMPNNNGDETDENKQENVPTELKEHYTPIRINCRKMNGNTIVEFELAGFTTKEISVILEDDAVTVTAVRKLDRQSMEICEIDNAKQRTILIGRGYTVEDFQHSFKNGILTLTFPSVKRNGSGRIQIL